MPGTGRLTRVTTILYGIGSISFGVKDNGFAFFLLLYYSQVLGLPESWVGFGIMMAGARRHLRPARRLCVRPPPFALGPETPVHVCRRGAGRSVVLAPLDPPSGLSQGGLFAYFFVVAVLVRLFIAVYEIPSASLVPELTDHYDERTTILSARYLFGWWGGLTMSVIAYAIFLQPDAAHPRAC